MGKQTVHYQISNMDMAEIGDCGGGKSQMPVDMSCTGEKVIGTGFALRIEGNLPTPRIQRADNQRRSSGLALR